MEMVQEGSGTDQEAPLGVVLESVQLEPVADTAAGGASARQKSAAREPAKELPTMPHVGARGKTAADDLAH